MSILYLPEPFEANSSILGFEKADVLWVILFSFFETSAGYVVLSAVDLFFMLIVDVFVALVPAFFVVELFPPPPRPTPGS